MARACDGAGAALRGLRDLSDRLTGMGRAGSRALRHPESARLAAPAAAACGAAAERLSDLAAGKVASVEAGTRAVVVAFEGAVVAVERLADREGWLDPPAARR